MALGPHWSGALESWTCPTPPGKSSAGEPCDPCGSQQWWGNWEHVACRSINTSYRFDQLANDGLLTHFHFSLTGVEGPAQALHDLLCPLSAHLKEWDMKVDNLNGPLPAGTPACMPRLEEYDLSRNHMTGTIPAELGSMPVMNQFKVQGNRLMGTLPPQLGQLRLLEWLRIFDNQLTGTIPDSYSALNGPITQVGEGTLACRPGRLQAAPLRLACTTSRLRVISIGGNLFSGTLYPFSEALPQNTNVTLLPHMCGMVPSGILFATGYDAYGSPGLGLPCPEELAGGWPDVADGF
ncbi:hypothetical protein ABPG75_010655 [Micractinium tetrahymenae]